MSRIVVPIFSTLIAVAIFFFVTIPMFDEVKAIQEEANILNQTVQEATGFRSILDSLINERNSLSAIELERLEALMPDSINLIQNIIDIETLALRNGLAFGGISLSLSPKNAESKDTAVSENTDISIDDLETNSISFTVDGTYEQMRAFLRDLEKSLVIVEVDSLSFSAQDETDSSASSFSFGVTVYSLKR